MDSFNISILNNVFRIMRTLCALDKIIFFFNKNIRKSVKVAVYGDSGTGKTQFLMTITGNNNYTAERTRSLKSFILILKNGRKIEFIDTPGHQSAKTIRDTLKRKFIKNKITGIINIVNYGYQDGDELNPDDVFNVDTKTVKDSYLSENREREIIRTKEFIETITPGIKLRWIITIVNKADIWFDCKREVMSYYEDGDYSNVISSLRHTTKLFVFPFCSVITPFANRPMMLKYSEKDKKKMFDELAEQLYNLTNNYNDA